jgi:hypothetical protein
MIGVGYPIFKNFRICPCLYRKSFNDILFKKGFEMKTLNLILFLSLTATLNSYASKNSVFSKIKMQISISNAFLSFKHTVKGITEWPDSYHFQKNVLPKFSFPINFYPGIKIQVNYNGLSANFLYCSNNSWGFQLTKNQIDFLDTDCNRIVAVDGILKIQNYLFQQLFRGGLFGYHVGWQKKVQSIDRSGDYSIDNDPFLLGQSVAFRSVQKNFYCGLSSNIKIQKVPLSLQSQFSIFPQFSMKYFYNFDSSRKVTGLGYFYFFNLNFILGNLHPSIGYFYSREESEMADVLTSMRAITCSINYSF